MRRFLCLSLALAACHGESVDVGEGARGPAQPEAPTTPEPPTETSGLTWHADIQPMMAQHCSTCHTAGGAGPFALDSLEQMKAMAPAALASIEAGRMPPWRADPDCREYHQQRIMPASDKDKLKRWVDSGMAAGDPGQVNVRQDKQVELGDSVLVETTPLAPYTPKTERPDDYRCFPLDVEFDQDTFIKGTEVVPGERAIVHHVLVYLATPDEVGTIDRLDAEDDEPGYTCYGGPGLNSVGPLAAWVPGMEPQIYPEDSSVYVPKGSRLVMQLHYNVLAAEPAPDLTTLQLFTTDTPTPFVIQTRPQADVGLRIGAGEPRVENKVEFTHRGAEPLTLVAVGPHMHVLGTEIKVELERANGDKECLINIDDWDFNWQQNYRFRAGEEVIVNNGDTFILTCVYDNSQANQPVVNGEQLPPRDVRWGEGTLDEMCLNFIAVKSPFVPASSGTCGGFDECRAECDDPDAFACVADCMSEEQSCGRCMLQELIGENGCTRPDCIGGIAAAQECFFNCYIGGPGLSECMQDNCPSEFDTIEACMGPKIAAGECDGAVNACTGG